MNAIAKLQAELDTLLAELATIPVDATAKAVDTAKARFEAARTIQETRFDPDNAKEATSAEIALIQAKGVHEQATNAARKIQNRVNDLTRMLACNQRIDAANVIVGALNEDLTEATHQANMIDAALAKLESLREAARERLTDYANSSADQLLIDAGLPGQEVTTPKSAEVTKTQHEVAAFQIAISKAQANQAAQQATITALHGELAKAQGELMDATADKLAIDHAQALGIYLPFLCAMRQAEAASRGYFSPAVDVEVMAKEIINTSRDLTGYSQ